MTDFIITNSDRHLNNFGILRDSETLKFIKPAPIFDSGNSMFYKSGYIPTERGLLDIKITSFYKKEVQMLKLVNNRGLVNISKLPSSDYVYNLLKLDDTLSTEKLEKILHAYNMKISLLSNFQNGADLWKKY